MKAEIEVNGLGHGRIALDGHDISKGVRAFTLTSGVGQFTHLELDVAVETTRLGADEVTACIPEGARQLLLQLGLDSTGRSGMTPLEIAAALRARRLELGLTQRQVAKQSGLSHSVIAGLEAAATYGNHRTGATVWTLERWAAALGGKVGGLTLTFPEPPVGTGIAPG